jgi:serine/threonine protein kinase
VCVCNTYIFVYVYIYIQVRKEMVIHKMLKHPNVVRMYTCFEERDVYYLIMEQVKGGLV